MASPLKIATVCMLLFLCVGSDLARPAICLASSPDDEEAAGAGALLKPSLLAEQDGGGVGDICTTNQCQNCLIMCLFSCIIPPAGTNFTTCFTNCTVTKGCFSMVTLQPVA